jgi:hypothetical protein
MLAKLRSHAYMRNPKRNAHMPRNSAAIYRVRGLAGRVLGDHDKGSQIGRDKEAVIRVVSSRKIRRVQDSFNKARKGEGLFGLRNAK